MHIFALSRTGKKQAALELMDNLKTRELDGNLREATMELDNFLNAN